MATNVVDDDTQAGVDAITLNGANTELILSDFLHLEKFTDILDINTERAFSPPVSYSVNPRHTIDNWPAFQFVQPLTPTVSSRSPSPVSSTASVDLTSPQISKAIRYIRQNLQREHDERLDQRLIEVEYRLRKEYLDKVDIQLQLERKNAEEEYQTHFVKVLQERMKEIVDQYNEQCDANRTEFEEILRERMAEVQAICNKTVEEKDREVARLKARLKAVATKSQTTPRKRGSDTRLQDKDFDEYVPSEVTELRSPAFIPERVKNVVKTTSDSPYLKDASIEVLRETFFRLQLNASIQHSELKQAREDLIIYREKLEKCRCGTQDGRIQLEQQTTYRDPEDRLSTDAERNREREVDDSAADSKMIMSSDRVSTPPRPFSGSPRWQPYPSPTPSPPTQPAGSATVRNREVSQTPSPLGSPFQTPPSSIMKAFPRNPPIWSGPSSSSSQAANSFDLRRRVDGGITSDEEEVDELQDDEDLDEPWIIE